MKMWRNTVWSRKWWTPPTNAPGKATKPSISLPDIKVLMLFHVTDENNMWNGLYYYFYRHSVLPASFFIKSCDTPEFRWNSNMDSHLVRLVGWLCWGLTSQSTIFQSYRDGAIASWVINQYFRGVKCLAQGHNTAAVGLEPRTSRSGVRHSTTEPPRSPTWSGNTWFWASKSFRNEKLRQC